MTSDLHDPLGRALDDLRGDVAATHLAGPAEIRARGDRRTRRQRAALGAGSVLAVAAIAVAGATLPQALQSGRATHPVPPAGGTPSLTLTTSGPPSGTSTPSSSSSPAGPRPVIDVTPVGIGQVPAAYFLPGTLWTGPDLLDGRKIESSEPREFEGSVQRFQCDPDGSLTGDVAFVAAVRTDGTSAGTQKVRLLDDPKQAASFMQKSIDSLLRCQERLQAQAKKDAANLSPGETAPSPTAEVTEDTSARVDDETGSVRLYKTVTDYGTGAGSRLIEWVAIAREGSAVTFVDLNQFNDDHVSFAALQRIAAEARAQLAWAATQR